MSKQDKVCRFAGKCECKTATTVPYCDSVMPCEWKGVEVEPQPSQVQEQCPGLHAPYHDLCPVCNKDLVEYWKKPTPPQEMPLIPGSEIAKQIHLHPYVMPAGEAVATAQRDADMAWHTSERKRRCQECLSKSIIEVADLDAHNAAIRADERARIKAEWNRKLEEMAEGILLTCEDFGLTAKQTRAIQKSILQQREQ